MRTTTTKTSKNKSKAPPKVAKSKETKPKKESKPNKAALEAKKKIEASVLAAHKLREEAMRKAKDAIERNRKEQLRVQPPSLDFMSLNDEDEEIEEETNYEGLIGPESESQMDLMPDHIEPIMTDVFTFAEKLCTPLGDMARFKIFKNGEYISLKTWPYSWDTLQRDYGQGFYRVQAIRGSTGIIIKTETQSIGDDPMNKLSKELPKVEEKPKSLFDDPVSTMAWMQQTQDRASEKARLEANSMIEREKIAAKMQMEQSKSFMEAIIATMQAQATAQSNQMAANQQMTLEMMKSNYERDLKSREEIARMMELQNRDRKPEMSSMDLLKFFQDAEKKGEDKAMMMNDLIETKVQLALESRSDEPAEKDSITDTLIKSFAPAVAGMIASGAQKQQPQLPPAPTHAHVSQAHAVTQPQPRREVHSQPGSPSSGQVKVAAPNQSAPVKINSQVIGSATTAGSSKSPVISPSISQTKNNAVNKTLDASVEATQTKRELELEQKIKDISLEVIGKCLMNQAAPHVGAQETLQELNKQGILPEMVVSVWSLTKLTQTAHDIGVPVELDPWFTEFWGEIERVVSVRGSTRKNITPAP